MRDLFRFFVLFIAVSFMLMPYPYAHAADQQIASVRTSSDVVDPEQNATYQAAMRMIEIGERAENMLDEMHFDLLPILEGMLEMQMSMMLFRTESRREYAYLALKVWKMRVAKADPAHKDPLGFSAVTACTPDILAPAFIQAANAWDPRPLAVTEIYDGLSPHDQMAGALLAVCEEERVRTDQELLDWLENLDKKEDG